MHSAFILEDTSWAEVGGERRVRGEPVLMGRDMDIRVVGEDPVDVTSRLWWRHDCTVSGDCLDGEGRPAKMTKEAS